jgi:hypothetical protein
MSSYRHFFPLVWYVKLMPKIFSHSSVALLYSSSGHCLRRNVGITITSAEVVAAAVTGSGKDSDVLLLRSLTSGYINQNP